MKRAFVFSAGEYQDPDFYKNAIEREPDRDILAVDGGLEILDRLKVKPQLLLGDFDSVDPDILNRYIGQNIKMLEYKPEKDQTDTELALNYLKENHYDTVTLFGGLGGRLDHTLANIYLLEKAESEALDLKIVDEKTEVFLLRGPVEESFDFTPGSIISLFPVTQEVTGLTLKGFKYPLDSHTFTRKEPTLCVSNLVTDKRQLIKFSEGTLIITDIKKDP